MYELIHKIYCLPFQNAVFISIICVSFWCIFGAFLPKKIWKFVNTVLLFVGLFGVIYTTLFRISGCKSISLTPFISFVNAKVQSELFRSMFFNCLLFIPFSLGLSGILPDKVKIGKRVLTVILLGFVLSVSVEALQYIFSLGNTEMDDVIMNSLGSVIGAFALFVQDKLCKLKNKKSKAGD